MSDSNTSPSLNPGSNTNPTDSTSTTPTDPDAGTPADPNVGPVGQQQTTGSATLLPSAAPSAPLANPNTIMSGDNPTSGTTVFENQSASSRNAIIIASAVSGAIGLILIAVVIWMIYRRRNRHKGSGGPNAGRPASDTSWVGPRLSPSDSFDDDKLEAGDRGSKADSMDSDTTLHDGGLAHKKSGSFDTSTQSPRPSMDKLRITTTLVSHDPFKVPRVPITKPGARPSFEQPASQGLLTPRIRKAPRLHVESSSNFNSGIVVEQGNPSPDVPLITPVDAWRSPIAGYNGNLFALTPSPARRDSMASLSRQSSRASSRNSPVLEGETAEATPRKKAMLSTIARKRRSRADSIDPFRKSAASTMMARRKSARTSRADALASRGASSSAGGVVRRKSSRSYGASRLEFVSAPTTPGDRRKSRTPRVASPVTPRRRSQATVNETRTFSKPLAPAAPRGLPTDPRTPSGATPRQSAHEPFTPRTSTPPVIHPETPRTPAGHARRSRAAVPRTPTSLEDAHWRHVPLPEPPATANPTTPRPLPAAPRTPQSAVPPPPKTPRTARAELRLSQLSRTLSDVSRESDYIAKAF
ncbi:hypothetical protein LXA43DRAFT_904025 [Ganoderma leucocontextum]|nr:hypothetical protein LXA43DRAFT_904025 [Ganoderma leucocontextum]